MDSRGRPAGARFLGWSARRCSGSRDRHQHDGARWTGVRRPRAGGGALAATCCAAGAPGRSRGRAVILVRVEAPTARARRALEAVLREDRGLSVVGTRSSLVTPDVVVLKRDSIPQLLAATTPTAPAAPTAPTAAVVMLLDDLDREAAAAAVRAGALAVLPADAEPLAIREIGRAS